MEKLTFYIVDVFAEEKYAGNQLAVVRGAKALSDTEMQRIAKEMNYSETTFILSDEKRNSGYDVRIFTPETELPFAGHPTLGTAYVIQDEIVKEPVDEIVLNLRVGRIPVTFSYDGKHADILWMKQLDPIFGQTLDAGLISEVLSLDLRDIDERFPVRLECPIFRRLLWCPRGSGYGKWKRLPSRISSEAPLLWKRPNEHSS